MSLNSRIKTICYFGICDMNYSRNKVFSDALKGQGVSVIECTTKQTGFRRYRDLYKKHAEIRGEYDAMIVGFPGFVVAQFARLISKKKVILDALSSRYDSDIVSRNAHKGNWFKKMKILFVDWLAFKCSHLILVETNAQKEFISNKFRISKAKIAVAYTGVDETVFKKDPTVQKHNTFTVIFRGRIMSEAGVPTILKSAQLLKDENINFDLIGYGWGPWIEESRELYKNLDHSKVRWDEKELLFEELVTRTQKAHVSLGQLGYNERLDRTIPHKAFESMVLGIPYVTARSKGIAEVLKEGESCLMVEHNNPEALGQAILTLKHDPVLRERLAYNAELVYRKSFDSRAIGQKLIKDITSIID